MTSRATPPETQKPTPRVPVSVVTGYLGSGKTTLIGALLKAPEMSGTALIVNEFGEVGIDDMILRQTTGNEVGERETPIALLANGCLCCAPGSDLAVAILDLLAPTGSLRVPRRIVIEASGAADTVEVLKKLMGDPRLRRAIRLDAVIVAVDALNALRNSAEDPLIERQIGVADRRVITKTDLADAETVTRVAEFLDELNPGAATIQAANGAVSPGTLFGASLFDEKTGRTDPSRWLNAEAYAAHSVEASHSHGQSIRSWVVASNTPVDWAKANAEVGRWMTRHGERVLRMKGIVFTSDDSRPLVIHGVQGLFHRPVRIASPDGIDRTSRIVIIADSAAEPAIEDIAKIIDGTVGITGDATVGGVTA